MYLLLSGFFFTLNGIFFLSKLCIRQTYLLNAITCENGVKYAVIFAVLYMKFFFSFVSAEKICSSCDHMNKIPVFSFVCWLRWVRMGKREKETKSKFIYSNYVLDIFMGWISPNGVFKIVETFFWISWLIRFHLI